VIDIPEHTDVHFIARSGFILAGKPTAFPSGGRSAVLPTHPVLNGDVLVWNSDLLAITVRRGNYSVDDPRFVPGVHVPGDFVRRLHELVRDGLIEPC
jgi:hypothetical protein